MKPEKELREIIETRGRLVDWTYKDTKNHNHYKRELNQLITEIKDWAVSKLEKKGNFIDVSSLPADWNKRDNDFIKYGHRQCHYLSSKNIKEER